MPLKPLFLRNNHPVDTGSPPEMISVAERLERRRLRDLRRKQLPDRQFRHLRLILGRDFETRPWVRNPDRPILRSVAPWFAYVTRTGYEYAEPMPEMWEEVLAERLAERDARQRDQLPSTSSIWRTFEKPKGERDTIMNPLHAPSSQWQYDRFFWRDIFQARRHKRKGHRDQNAGSGLPAP
jgi:hypothetical protein